VRHAHLLRDGRTYTHTHDTTDRHLRAYRFAHPEGDGDPDADKDPCGDPDCQCDAYTMGMEEE
jgi:hypothetical protein